MSKAAKIVAGLAVVFALTICAAGGWLISRWIDLPAASGELDEAIAQSKRLGLPMVASDLDPRPPIHLDKNAAPGILAAGKLFDAIPDHSKIVAELVARSKKNDFSRARPILEKFDPTLSKFRGATRMPQCHFERDWDLAYRLDFPEYARIKGMVRLLSVRAQLRAKEGDVKGSLDDLSSIGRVCSFCGNEPFLIGMLVDIAIGTIRLEAIESIAARWADQQQLLRKLATELNSDGVVPDPRIALRGEYYFGVAFFRNFDLFTAKKSSDDDGGADPPIDPVMLQRSGLPQSIPVRALLTRHVQLFNGFFEFAREESDPRKLAKKMEELIESERISAGMSYSLSYILAPIFVQAANACVRELALIRCTKALLKVLEYRCRKNAFPSQLSDAGARELDPFDNQPLRYVHTDSSCRIYSVGIDGTDDRGVTNAEANAKGATGHHYDDAVGYPPVPSR